MFSLNYKIEGFSAFTPFSIIHNHSKGIMFMKINKYFNHYTKEIILLFIIYIVLFEIKLFEYMGIRTDQSMIGEAIFHKLAGILILLFIVRYLSLKWSEIGFINNSIGKYTAYGLMLGVSVYFVAYGTELIIQQLYGKNPSLQFYMTSYTPEGNQVLQHTFLFFFILMIGNVINVIMEEGIFRGLFIKLLEMNYSFSISVLISSLLFGIWHIAAPIRDLFDGKMSLNEALFIAFILTLTAGITGIKFALLVKITGSLWMPMADHFVNNTTINLFHIVTTSGVDELQFIRITIAQTVSFIIVLFIYWKTKAHHKQTFRI